MLTKLKNLIFGKDKLEIEKIYNGTSNLNGSLQHFITGIAENAMNEIRFLNKKDPEGLTIHIRNTLMELKNMSRNDQIAYLKLGLPHLSERSISETIEKNGGNFFKEQIEKTLPIFEKETNAILKKLQITNLKMFATSNPEFEVEKIANGISNLSFFTQTHVSQTISATINLKIKGFTITNAKEATVFIHSGLVEMLRVLEYDIAVKFTNAPRNSLPNTFERMMFKQGLEQQGRILFPKANETEIDEFAEGRINGFVEMLLELAPKIQNDYEKIISNPNDGNIKNRMESEFGNAKQTGHVPNIKKIMNDIENKYKNNPI